MIKASWTDAAEERLKRSPMFRVLSGIAPNALTTLGVAISLLGAWAFAVGSFALGGLLILAGGIFDLFDGVVARHAGRVSTFGGLLDSTADRLVDMAVLLSIAFCYAQRGAWVWFGVAALALIGSVLVPYIKARGENDVPGLGVGWLERGERVGLIIAGGILGLMPLALLLLAGGSWWTAGQRLALARQKMDARDAAA